MRGLAAGVVLSIGAAMSGCSTLPVFEHSQGENLPETEAAKKLAGVPDVARLVDHIQCELKAVLDDPDPRFDRLRSHLYVAYASLTVEVTVDEALKPSLSFIDPLSIAGTSKALALGGQLTGEQHRNINQNFAVVLDPKHAARVGYPTAKEEACKNEAGKDGLRGRLGLKEVIAAGLAQLLPSDFLFPMPTEEQAGSVKLAPSLAPNFGATIDFTITRGVNGGPIWTLSHFTGPGSPGGPLLDWTRTVKDTLVISFAPAGAPDRAGNLPATGDAGRTAQDNVTRMILQRILPR
jgi:hypothetical protein